MPAGGELVALPAAPLAHASAGVADQCSSAALLSATYTVLIVAYGADGGYWRTWRAQADSNHHEWLSMGGGLFASGPALVRDGDGALVLGNGLDGHVRTASVRTGGGMSEWRDLGGRMVGRPAPIVDGAGMLHVFAVSAADRVAMHSSRHGSAWSAWQPIDGVTSSAISPLRDGAGLIHLFTRGLDRTVWHKAQASTAAPKAPLGGSLIAPPLVEAGAPTWKPWVPSGRALPVPPMLRIAAVGDGAISVLVRGSDRALWEKARGRDGWAAWRSLGGSLVGGPAAVRTPAGGGVAVYANGVDGAIWSRSRSGGEDATWTNWSRTTPEGRGAPELDGSPEAVADTLGGVSLYARTADGALWWQRSVAAEEIRPAENATATRQTGVAAEPWASLGGRFRSFNC